MYVPRLRFGLRSIRSSTRSVLLPVLLHETEPLRVDLLRAGEQVAPDAGGGRPRRQGPAKRLDHQPAVVVDLAQRLEGLRPVDVAGARRGPGVLSGVRVDRT